MKKLLIMFAMGLIALAPNVSANAQENMEWEIEALKDRVQQLEERLRKQRLKASQLEEKIAEGEEKAKAPESWVNRVAFSGALELDYSAADDSDIGNNTVNDSTSELDIGTAELGLEVSFHECVTGNFVLKGENLGSEDDRIFWDEASIKLQKEGFPLYFIGGHRGQPFGLFENHLISDPITKDLYEIVRPGATVGFLAGFLGLDISATVYKGEELIEHMLEGAYGLGRDYMDTAGNLPGWRPGGMSEVYDGTDDVSSYIGNVTLSPMEGVTISGFYDSEPGDGRRNETAGGALHIEYRELTFDGEYMFAIQREADSADGTEHDESAWFASVAYQAMEPLKIAARYESFDDDIAGEQAGHLKDRYSIGVTYRLFKHDDFVTNLMGEYRRSRFEVETGNPNWVDDKVNEVFLRLALEF